MKALSLRQPWAWLVTNGPAEGVPWKPIENREWTTDKNHFGRTLIHASSGMSKLEYNDCKAFIIRGVDLEQFPAKLLQDFPAMEGLLRGGIVGEVEIIGYMRRMFDGGISFRGMTTEQGAPFSISPWYFGTVGICLRNCKSLPFRPLKGMLGFFNVEEAS